MRYIKSSDTCMCVNTVCRNEEYATIQARKLSCTMPHHPDPLESELTQKLT